MKEFTNEAIKQYSQSIYRYAFSRLGDRSDAEDVLQETFARALAHADKLETISNHEAWLIGIARNVLLESYRSKAQIVTSLDSEPDEGEVVAIDDNLAADTQIIESELLLIIKEELKNLDPLTREIIELRTWENLKFSEIAAVTGLNEQRVKKRYYRGIQELNAKLNHKEHKQRAIALPILIHGLQQLRLQPELLVPVEVLSNLNLTTAAMQPNLLSHFAGMSTAAKLIITLLAITMLGLIGLFVLLTINADQPGEVVPPATSSSTTATPPPAVIVTPPTSSAPAKILLKQTIYPAPPAGGGIDPVGTKVELTFTTDPDFSLESGKLLDATGKVVLTFGLPYEWNNKKILSHDLIGTHWQLGQVYRSTIDSTSYKGVNYLNSITLTGTCVTGDDDIPAPCGDPILLGDAERFPSLGEDIAIVIRCADENRLALCDELVLAMRIKGVLYTDSDGM